MVCPPVLRELWVADFAMLVMLKGALARHFGGATDLGAALSRATVAATSQLLFTTGLPSHGMRGREFQNDSRDSYW